MGMGLAAAWPMRKRARKKAIMEEGEKNIVAGLENRRTREWVGGWCLLEGRKDSRSEVGRTCGLSKDKK